jgi:hypothetical protein
VCMADAMALTTCRCVVSPGCAELPWTVLWLSCCFFPCLSLCGDVKLVFFFFFFLTLAKCATYASH